MTLLMKLLGHLPLWLLYGLSDMLWPIVCYIVRYRRRVVLSNLRTAFPDMSSRVLRRTMRRFYRNLSDYFFETAHLSSVSDAEMRRRMVFGNIQLIDSLLDSGQSVAVYFSHCFNWEWAPSVTLWTSHANDPHCNFCQVYRPLKNKEADRWFLGLRSRFRSISIPKHSVFRDLLRLSRNGNLSVTGFMSDQRVSHTDSGVVIDFLGRPTEFIKGTETLARKLNLAAVYWDMERTGRGHYRITTRLLSDNPASLPDGELTRRYAEMLQTTLRRDPSNWLWSHKRWKHVNHPH